MVFLANVAATWAGGGLEHCVLQSRGAWWFPPESVSLLLCPHGGGHACPILTHLCSLPTAGSAKYFGTAKARYDFCARDRSELSLKEGDIIKILNKKGQQGWWRGEIYGRVRDTWVWVTRVGWPGCGGDLAMGRGTDHMEVFPGWEGHRFNSSMQAAFIY